MQVMQTRRTKGSEQPSPKMVDETRMEPVIVMLRRQMLEGVWCSSQHLEDQQLMEFTGFMRLRTPAASQELADDLIRSYLVKVTWCWTHHGFWNHSRMFFKNNRYIGFEIDQLTMSCVSTSTLECNSCLTNSKTPVNIKSHYTSP